MVVAFVSELNRTKAKRGNIAAETFEILDVSSNLSPLAHSWKRCESKIAFLESKKHVA